MAAGSCAITVPSVPSLGWKVTDPTSSPAPRIFPSADAWSRPRTLGTVTCSGPVDTTIVTSLPFWACAFAAGRWLITTPSSTVSLADSSTFTANSSARRAAVASLWL